MVENSDGTEYIVKSPSHMETFLFREVLSCPTTVCQFSLLCFWNRKSFPYPKLFKSSFGFFK